MAKRRPLNAYHTVIDSESPWRVTQRGWNRSYGYKTSVSEWRSLLARAKKGDREAELEVADRYEDGCKDRRGKIIVRRSAAKAAKWFGLAAEHGSASAQNNLGVLLGDGDGVRKNVEEALFWLRKAFRAGNTCAAHNIAITYRQNGNLKAAFEWFRRAAETGDGDALIQLGIHYYWGKGVRKNPRTAVRCFRTATRVKNISGGDRDDAFFFLGIAYREGRGVQASMPKARKSFEQANIDNDHVAANNMLSELRP